MVNDASASWPQVRIKGLLGNIWDSEKIGANMPKSWFGIFHLFSFARQETEAIGHLRKWPKNQWFSCAMFSRVLSKWHMCEIFWSKSAKTGHLRKVAYFFARIFMCYKWPFWPLLTGVHHCAKVVKKCDRSQTKKTPIWGPLILTCFWPIL